MSKKPRRLRDLANPFAWSLGIKDVVVIGGGLVSLTTAWLTINFRVSAMERTVAEDHKTLAALDKWQSQVVQWMLDHHGESP